MTKFLQIKYLLTFLFLAIFSTGIFAAPRLIPTKLKSNNASTSSGFAARLTAQLSRADTNVPIGNAPIQFYIDNIKVGEGSTDVLNGTTQIQVPINQPGNEKFPITGSKDSQAYPIRAEYKGSNEFRSANSDVYELTVVKSSPRLSAVSLSAKVGSFVTISTVLTNSAGSVLPGRKVEFTINNRSVGSYTTNANGVAQYGWKVSTSGINTLKVNFVGDDFYRSTTTSGSIFGIK